MKKVPAVFALTGLFAMAPLALGQTLVDDFSTNQGPLSLTAVADIGVTTGSTISGAGILGTERDMELTLVNGSDGLSIVALVDGGDTYNHSQDTSVTGISRAVWDGSDGDDTTIDFTGLGGLDLTVGSPVQNAFQILVVSADLGSTLVFEVWTDASNSSTYTLNLAGGALNTVFTLKFGDFVTNLGAGADFTNVGAIRMTVDGSAVAALDVTVDQFETTTTCGDGVLDFGEECDDGVDNSDTEPDACRTDCTLPVCGDGVVDTGEECDDGVDNSDTEPDACRTDCTLPVCGDGVVDTGEECDDGVDNSDTTPDACRTDCTLPECGDGVVDSGEECDDGVDNSDTNPNACRTDCSLPACGDGVVDSGEECDDGAANSDTNPDACRTDCTLPECGDGVVDTGEECDDGAGNSDTDPDACRTDCTLPFCGDGVVDSGEQCDDGVDNSDTTPDACRTDCTLPFCGDGIIDSGEQCDAGVNNSDTLPDTCRTDCSLPFCGDGVLDTGEECDDGNNAAGDGCSAGCRIEDGGVIPTTSEWGLVVLTLMLVTVGKVAFRRRDAEMT